MKKNKINLVFLSFFFVFLFVFISGSVGVAESNEEKYTFYFVSHIGPADVNIKWLTTASEDFMKRFPEVKIVYVAPEKFSIEQQRENIRAAIAANPDGLIVPITDPTAFDEILRHAIVDLGIPVIASNVPDPRPKNERIPYLTYVGGDEYLTGYQLAEEVIKAYESGQISKPTKAVAALAHVGHVGWEMRTEGFRDAMAEIGVLTEKLAVGDDPVQGKEIMRSYLINNPETNVMLCGFNVVWAYKVGEELGLHPNVDEEGLTLVSVDASPMALEGIINKKMLASHSQGFYLQGYLPPLWLYFYNKYGFEPPDEILTGPIPINKDNVQQWKDIVMSVFGEEVYYSITGW